MRYPDSLLSISSVENSTHGMSEGRTMSILGATLPFWAPMETLLCGFWLFADLSLPSQYVGGLRGLPTRGPEGPQPVDSGAPAGQELERGSPCARNKSWRGTEICGRGGL